MEGPEMGKKTVNEEPLSEYDEGEIPGNKAQQVLDEPEENEEYFPYPYKYYFKGNKIDREIYNDLKSELKDTKLLKKELKTKDELEQEIMQDSRVYETEWDFFLEDITGLMNDRNPDGYWETPCNVNEFVENMDCEATDRSTGNGSHHFFCDHGKELLKKFIDYNRFQYGTGPIRLYDYKSRGFKIQASHHDDTIFLPACKSGFIRDWDHDGICIASLPEEEE